MTPLPQDLDGLQEFLDIHGADPRRWPTGMEQALTPWFARDPRALALLARARKLEALIEAAAPAPAAPSAFDPSRAMASTRSAQVTPLRPMQSAAAPPIRRLRPILALAASLILGFFFGAGGWMPGGRASSLDTAEIAALAADAFGLDDAL